MDIVQLVVIGMVLTILATVTLAAVSYGAFKMRERKKPGSTEPRESVGPLFFERVRFLPREDASPAD